MQKERTKWRADPAARALKRLAEIEESITTLKDNDLLDFADIFVANPETPLSAIAAAEMIRRKISL